MYVLHEIEHGNQVKIKKNSNSIESKIIISSSRSKDNILNVIRKSNNKITLKKETPSNLNNVNSLFRSMILNASHIDSSHLSHVLSSVVQPILLTEG